ncbi:MAG: hypothetical protein M3Z85_15795, partial [Acidobacteriota bacterium]|nr:hypothetical protein [Acidobacteriota bacterium]
LQGLEQEMQRTARDLADTQRAASTKLREGLGNMQQQELQTRMKWTQEALRRGLGSYAVMREAPVTQGLNQLKDQLRQAQGALDRGQQPGQQGKDKLEQALSQAENLRQQIEQMRNGQGKPGEGQQKGQQPGQQPGQQGQSGQQPGQSSDPNATQDGQSGGQGMGTFNSSTRGGQQPSGGPVGPNRDPEGNYRDTLRDFGRLQQAVQGNPEVAREVQDLSRQMQRLNPNRYSSNPELLEQIHSRILAQIEQVELMLRRKIDEQGGTVRSGAQQTPPPGYADAVAEYFRRLSKEH